MLADFSNCVIFCFGAPRLFVGRRYTLCIAYEKHCPEGTVIIRYFSVGRHPSTGTGAQGRTLRLELELRANGIKVSIIM
jgi:hypothetical protein